MAEITHKEYLGDGVYAAVEDGFQVVLTTHDGYRDTNTICLEPEVAAALIDYIRRSGIV